MRTRGSLAATVAIVVVASGCRDGARPATAIPPWFAAPDAAPRRIAGHVRLDQAPTSARVHLRLAGPDPTVWVGVDVEARADGAFDFGARPPGRYLVVALTSTGNSRPVEVDTRGGDVVDVDVFVHPCTRHEGRLMDGPAPVARATFELGGVIVATSGRDGRYVFCVAHDPDRAGRVRVRPRDHAVPTTHALDEGLRDTELVEAAELRGVVRDRDGHPVTGIGVQPILVRQRAITHFPDHVDLPIIATTDTKGRFRIRGAPRREAGSLEARFVFRLVHAGHTIVPADAVLAPAGSEVSLILDPTRRAEVPEGADALAGPVLAGRVTHEGRPLADALITLEADGDGGPANLASARTGRDGAFRVATPSHAGVVEVHVAHARGLSTARRTDADQPRTDLVIDVRPASAIAGLAVGADGAPLVGTSVRISARDAPIRRTGAVDAAGRFHVTGLESGREYEVEVGRARGTLALGVAPVTDLRFVEAQPWTIEGLVLDERGEPAAGVEVLAGGARVAITGSDGRFRWQPPLARPLGLVAVAPDGSQALAPRVAPGEVLSPLRLARVGSLRVRCGFRTLTGVHVARELVEVRTDCDLQARSLAPGAWRIAASDARGGIASADVAIRAGRTTTVDLAVAPPIRIVGRAVEDPGGRRIAGARCRAMVRLGTVETPRGADAVTAADGSFALEAPAGELSITCEDPTGRHAAGAADVRLDRDGDVTVRMVPDQLDGGASRR